MSVSRQFTKSVNTASTRSSPARTLITSELGFVYFLLKIVTKNTVKVYIVSVTCHA